MALVIPVWEAKLTVVLVHFVILKIKTEKINSETVSQEKMVSSIILPKSSFYNRNRVFCD